MLKLVGKDFKPLIINMYKYYKQKDEHNEQMEEMIAEKWKL